jgi:hypothetical protein
VAMKSTKFMPWKSLSIRVQSGCRLLEFAQGMIQPQTA